MSKLALVAGLAVAAVATARPVYTNAAPASIPDNAPTGGVTRVIAVPDSFTVTAGTTVAFDRLAHTWVGDLIFRLTSPAGTTVTFLNRPGFTGTGFGNSADFVNANSYAWADGGLAFPTASPPTVIPSGTYAPANPFAAFNGENSLGNWTITAIDNAAGDLGSWQGVSLTLVPTPGAVALFGLAGLAGLRRRR